MINSTLKASLLALVICASIGLTSCGKSDSSDGASQADIDALSLIVGKKFSETKEQDDFSSESFTIKSNAKAKFKASSGSYFETIADGNELSFLGTTLITHSNAVIYDSNEYTLSWGFINGEESYYDFTRVISETDTSTVSSGLSIDSTPLFTSNFIRERTDTASGNTTTSLETVNGTVKYHDDSNEVYAQFNIQDATISSIYTSDEEESSAQFNISYPFALTIGGLEYSGELAVTGEEVNGEASESNSEYITSTLTRAGKIVGELRIEVSNSEIKVFIKNSDGDLEELIVD
jgi:hypothetical protein